MSASLSGSTVTDHKTRQPQSLRRTAVHGPHGVTRIEVRPAPCSEPPYSPIDDTLDRRFRSLRLLDLRTERNLDALHVDDQISTGQHEAVWNTCQHLADAARRWWPDLDAIVYRSRTTPSTSANYAFFGIDGFTHEWWPLAERSDVLIDLVLREGFTVDWDIGPR